MPEAINVKILHLVVRKKWYEMQESGEKTEEYREITPYWYQRLYQRKKEFAYAGRLTIDDAEYACDLIDKAGGVRVRVRATCMQPFTDLLEREEYQVKRVGTETKAYVAKKQGDDDDSQTGDNGGNTPSGELEG